MNCTTCQEMLTRQADGDALATERQRAVDDHLATCPSCSALAQQLAGLLAAAGSLRELTYERPVVVAPLVLRPKTLRPFFAGVLATASVAGVFALGLYAGREPRQSVAVSPDLRVVRLVVPAVGARRVEVVGDFTGWHDRMALAPAADGLWVGDVKVTPGRYKYMIVVDDAALQPDPAAREVVDDGFGGKNSVLDVGSI